MKLSIFKDIRTTQDLRNRLDLLQSIGSEYGKPMSKMLTVDSDDYYEMIYVLSDSRNDIVLNNYFTYKNKETGLVGLCKVKGGSDKIIDIFEPTYVRFLNLHPLVWLGLRQDSLYDLVVKGRIVASGFGSFDVTSLGDTIQFIKLYKGSFCSLICLDFWDVQSGVFAPNSLEDFNEWFMQIVALRGYDCKLDDVLVSDLFFAYFEIKNCIFELGKLQPIVLDEEV